MSERVIKKVRCNICSVGCPIDAYVEDGKLVSVEGSRDLPGQSGDLCSKGAASRQYVYNKDRILYPMKHTGEKGSGEFERISWEEAYQIIAENLYDREFVEKYVYGFDEYKEYVQKFTPDKAEMITGVDRNLIRKAARIYASNGPAGVITMEQTEEKD